MTKDTKEVKAEAELSADKAYYEKWYEANGSALNSGRRDRYLNDPIYKAKVLTRNRKVREKRRLVSLKTRAEERKSMKVLLPGQPWKVVEAEVDGKPVVLFSIGALARSLGRSVQAIRIWENTGVIPPAEIRNEKGDRLYTLDQVESLRKTLKEAGRLGGEKTHTKTPLAGQKRKVRLADGTKKELLLFHAGKLAVAIERTVVTVDQLERRGALPPTPFRSSKTQRRLYTAGMIVAAREAFESQFFEIRGAKGWKQLHDEILAAWVEEGIIGAQLDTAEDA